MGTKKTKRNYGGQDMSTGLNMVKFNPNLHKHLKRLALEKEITLYELVEIIVADFLKKAGIENPWNK